jgi:hypothetical protein
VAGSAAETARERTQEHGQDLAETARQSAQEVTAEARRGRVSWGAMVALVLWLLGSLGFSYQRRQPSATTTRPTAHWPR